MKLPIPVRHIRMEWSLPTRERGLKLCIGRMLAQAGDVAPHMGARIETTTP
ncbi:hypothetical protein ACRQU7_16565 [Caproiciproducens sp. R1]|uniref:hypothetical protein n=1 Tax=Caproiciproducens sp. R1 TaxID=3435000 RepID=UPI0040336FA1